MLTTEFKEWCDWQDASDRHRLDILLTSGVHRTFLPTLFSHVRSQLLDLIVMEEPSKMAIVDQILFVTRQCLLRQYFSSINDTLKSLKAAFPDVVEDMGKMLTSDEKDRLFSVYR
jgi:hypothetical protein